MTSTAKFPTEACRSCQAPIIWCTTERGRAMPVDAQPSTGGNLLLRRRIEYKGNCDPLAVLIDATHRFGRTDLHTSHFATCPNAETWRTKRRSTNRG